MSVIAVNASPRPDGSTGKLIQEVIAGTEEAGKQAQVFQLGRMNISPCTACMQCRKTAECAVKDDMIATYEAVDSAAPSKALVIGTPIYFDHVSAQFKGWLDRLYCYCYTERGQRMFPKGFKAVLVATYEAPDPHCYDFVLEWLKERLEFYHEIEVVAQIAMGGSAQKPLDQRPDLVDRARDAGRLLLADK